MTTLWQDFENYVLELLKKEFSDFAIVEQYILTSGRKPDFILDSGDTIGIADAKEKRRISISDIEQMRNYDYELEPNFKKIYVSSYSKISKKVAKLASENDIEIIKTKWDVQTFYERLNQKYGNKNDE